MSEAKRALQDVAEIMHEAGWDDGQATATVGGESENGGDDEVGRWTWYGALAGAVAGGLARLFRSADRSSRNDNAA